MPREFVFDDRVLVPTTSTGMGAIDISATPIEGFRPFPYIPGRYFGYSIVAVDSGGTPSGEYETGLGFGASSTTFTRPLVFSSSNDDGPVNWAAGTKRVSMVVPAQFAGTIKRRQLNTTTPLHVKTTGDDTADGRDFSLPLETLYEAGDRVNECAYLPGDSVTINIGEATTTSVFAGAYLRILADGPDVLYIDGQASADTAIGYVSLTADKPCSVHIRRATLSEGVGVGSNITLYLDTDIVIEAGTGFYADIVKGGSLQVASGTAVSGDVDTGFNCFGGVLEFNGNLDVPNNVTITGQFVNCDAYGYVNVESLVKTGAGTVTGKRYNAQVFGTIDANGSGSTVIPGSTSGTTASGGQYLV